MLDLSILLDTSSARQYVKKIQKQVVPKATVRSINRTLDQVNVRVARIIAKEMGMKVGAVKKRLKKIKATRGRFVAKLRPHHWTPNLIEFGARSLKNKGVSHKAWGNRQKTRGAFIGKGRTSGKRLVYARTTENRYPIKALYGPTLRKTFIEDRIMKVMKMMAKGRFPKNFNADFRYYLSKVK